MREWTLAGALALIAAASMPASADVIVGTPAIIPS